MHTQKETKEQRFVSHPLIYPNVVEGRLYQKHIAEAALEKNTLVILPTGLGKTIIAALVTAEILYNYRDSKVLMMAPTRPLVIQHKTNFERVIRLPKHQFALLTGRTPPDYRSEIWSSTSPRVVFATPQVVRNDLHSGCLQLSGFGLVIFDECHRSIKEYAYTEIARRYAESSTFPLLLGMTASPGSDWNKVRMVCESLYVEHVEHLSVEDEDVKPYVNPVVVEWETVTLPMQYQPVREILRGMFNERVEKLRIRGYLRSKSKFLVSRRELIELGSYPRYKAEMAIEEKRGPIYGTFLLQSQALTLFHMAELFDTQGAHTLRCFMKRLEEGNTKRSHSSILKEEAYKSIKQLLEKNCNAEHPKS
jgi:ERCC4-related helicase